MHHDFDASWEQQLTFQCDKEMLDFSTSAPRGQHFFFLFFCFFCDWNDIDQEMSVRRWRVQRASFQMNWGQFWHKMGIPLTPSGPLGQSFVKPIDWNWAGGGATNGCGEFMTQHGMADFSYCTCYYFIEFSLELQRVSKVLCYLQQQSAGKD